MLGFVTCYFLVAFIIYSLSDFLVWRLTFIRAREKNIRENARAEHEFMERGRHISDEEEVLEMKISKLYRTNKSVFILSGPTSIIRSIFEFALPIGVGIYTILLLWKVIP